MSTFVLRILFTGLMAFIPNEGGTEVTVLLLNADHYHTSDGAAMQQHEAILYARAGGCTGNCVDDDAAIAAFTFRDQSSSAALDSLAAALGDGSAWKISGSDISFQKVSGAANLPALNIVDDVRGTEIIPTTSTERKDISWVASLTQICGSGCTIDSDLLATIPPEIVAARFTIDSGDFFTWSVARLGSDVIPAQFRRLDGTGTAASYVQSIASWIGTEITVTGTAIEFVETKHDSSSGRTMTLTPDASNKVEIAVINLPPFVPPASTSNDAPQVGKHFEMYYDLLQNPPDHETRRVPFAGAPSGTSVPQVSWATVHPSSAVYSDLLNALRFDVGRSLYDRTICPPTIYP